MKKRKQRKQKNTSNCNVSGRGFGGVTSRRDAVCYKQLLKEAIESRKEKKVNKALSEMAAPLCEGDIPKVVVSEALAEISYGGFAWYYKTFLPERAAKFPIPDENYPALGDKFASHAIQLLIQNGLIFGQDFSFYCDENSARHLKISSEGLKRLSPSTVEYINSVTDANFGVS